jgi:4'-phosphopantetheinyl transferase
VVLDCEQRPTLYWISRELQDVPPGDEWLGHGEFRVLQGLRFPKRRNDWRLSRWVGKLAVQGCGSDSSCSVISGIEILAADDGAPEVFIAGRRAGLSLSLSHSAEVGFCVVAKLPMALGCDIERIEPRDSSFVADYFSVEETAAVQRADSRLRELLITLIWSSKESALKALREGLRRDTRSVVIFVDPTDCAPVSWHPLRANCPGQSKVFYGWWRVRSGFVWTILSDRDTGGVTEIP